MPDPTVPASTPPPGAAGPVLLRGARLVDAARGRAGAPTDLRMQDGRVVEVGAGLSARGAEVVQADGTWAVPGLWDQHVHLGQWGMTFRRLDTASAGQPADVLATVAARVAELDRAGAPATLPVIGFGHRTGSWWQPARVADLDRVAGAHPVLLISGDVHSCWMSSTARALLGLPPGEGAVEELEWFSVQPRLLDLPGAAEENERGVRQAVLSAAARGVVGITDLEFAPNHRLWPRRWADGLQSLRVRAGVYPDRLAEVLAAGLRTGDPLAPELDPEGLLRMGPLKIISDGSLNTRTAWCCDPYAVTSAELAAELAGPGPSRGRVNYPVQELAALLARAAGAGLESAVHALGDAAVAAAVTAFEQTGAHGSIEHAQLAHHADLARMAAAGVRASVQPGHLWDDRDVSELNWPGRGGRCFMLASMRDLGVELVMGSDAPVAPLDPWRTMAAAVHRSGDDREPWHPEQALTAGQALAASTDRVPVLAAGGPADVVLVDRDPLAPPTSAPGSPGASAEVAAHLQQVVVRATWVAGRQVH